MFAVMKTGGKQYRVAADDTLAVERVAGDVGDTIVFDQVLMMGEGADVTMGAPTIDGAFVSAEILDQNRGPKVIAFKKRRRQNSKRTRGHRQLLTTVRITSINADGKKPAPKKAKAEKPQAEKPKQEEAPKAAAAAAADDAAAPLFSAPEGAADDLKKKPHSHRYESGNLRYQT